MIRVSMAADMKLVKNTGFEYMSEATESDVLSTGDSRMWANRM